ncbi:hypothetical protein Pan153_32080 [Gimesia panareensis]|uniref:Uncharacterized protein n=1 Tax=Gimesia panareensis TaxID=2527978 RepID=A0A518FQC6_9PLAN|nr:hypothetical protein [Gimesia panareensis]QDV18549.1 hypothetical protein Pan153_32080 [Gimesia panareensis]
MAIMTAGHIFLKRPYGVANATALKQVLQNQGSELYASPDQRYWELIKNQLIITIRVQPITELLDQCQDELKLLRLAPDDVPEVITVEGLTESFDHCQSITDQLAVSLSGVTRGAEHCH